MTDRRSYYHCHKCDGVLDFREVNRGICDKCHKESLTTEQLALAALETVRQMSPEQKAKLRQQLDDQLTSLMVVRQTLVCGDCGAVIEGGDLPQEEDWVCPNCGYPSNLELTWLISIQGEGKR